ncbi:MAG: RNA polymerase sigma factor, partial [Planctomycetaceae bacterium]
MSSTLSLTDLSDEQLAESISVRHESCERWRLAQECFEELYRRHGRNMSAFLAARVLSSEIEDMHQAVFERVWEHLPQKFHGGHFRAWLFKIARNYVIDQGRRRTMDHWEDDTQFPDPNPPLPDEQIVETESQRRRTDALRQCMEKLSERESDAVRRRM